MEPRLLSFLLVEDDDSHAAITLRSLKLNRVANDVVRARDGDEALRYLRRLSNPLPDIILLDLKLPKVDGHEVLAAVKQDPRLCTIPVVVLTTSDADIDRLRAYRHHANSYLVKPTDFDEFRKLAHDLSLYWGVWNRPGGDAGMWSHG